MSAAQWLIQPATPNQLLQLMDEFDSADALTAFGGEGFIFPPKRQQFLQQLLLKDTLSYCLCNAQGDWLGFGQICDRFNRLHLARLYIAPSMRGQQLIDKLIAGLLGQGVLTHGRRDASLYVFRHNMAARQAYQRLGFCETNQPTREQRADLLFLQLPYPKVQQLSQSVHWLQAPTTPVVALR